MLNAALIRERRLEMGMSVPQLAAMLGRSTTVVEGLERGTNHGKQTLALLATLADALAMNLTDLFELTEAKPPAPDDIRLEAALAATGTGLSAETVAHALGWSLPRTHQAIKALRDRLGATGQQLRQNAGKYRLVYNRGKISTDELRRLERRRVTTLGLRQQEAQVLLAVLRGQATSSWHRNKGASSQINIARLERLGYAEHGASTWHLTEAVTYSLGLLRA